MNRINELPKRPRWPEYYLKLEAEYTKDLSDEFYSLMEGPAKEWARRDVLRARVKFKKWWNRTHHIKFDE